MGIESRDYFREWMRRRDGRAEPPVAPEHQVKPKPVWPKDNPRGSLPFRRRGTGQHVELAGLREELRHSEAATHAGRTGRGSGPHGYSPRGHRSWRPSPRWAALWRC